MHPLTHVTLEGGCLLWKIILLCFESAVANVSDDGIDGVKKNPYRFNVRRKFLRSDDYTSSKLQRKTSTEKVRKVSSIHCCSERCCQTFDWEETLRIWRKFHSGPYVFRCEARYLVLGQLHELSENGKKFITLANRDVCKNAWYIIHRLLRSAFYFYKSTAKAGSVSGFHGNLGVLKICSHMIQAEANMMTIINDTADMMLGCQTRFRILAKSEWTI
jgi:hypothetical protein